MSTPAQREFLRGHIEVLREQTETAQETENHLLTQITASRLLRLLGELGKWVEALPDDGDQGSVWRDPASAAILEGLGFEPPEKGEEG